MTALRRITICLALAILASCSPDPLKAGKRQVKKNYQNVDPALLVPVVAKELSLTARSGPSEKIQMAGGVLSVPKPDSVKETKPGRMVVTCGPITAFVLTAASKSAFDSLPASWGSDDIEKVRFICATSERDIDAATDADQLADVTARLAAKATAMPPDAAKGLVGVAAETFTGLLAGDFDTIGRAELVFRPKQEDAVYYRIVFRNSGEAAPGEFMRFLESLSFSPNS